jgi:predicted DCC family thiol-disulfide oxidoreductase YuxK
MAEAQLSGAAFERLVLFDGVCTFCDASVRWLMERDPAGRLQYAPLQGEAAAALRCRHRQIPDNFDTLVYVERHGAGEQVHLRSAAIFRICAQLQPPPAWLPWLSWLPAPLADVAYRVFARLRYRIFGKQDECRLPSETERSRFLA